MEDTAEDKPNGPEDIAGAVLPSVPEQMEDLNEASMVYVKYITKHVKKMTPHGKTNYVFYSRNPWFQSLFQTGSNSLIQSSRPSGVDDDAGDATEAHDQRDAISTRYINSYFYFFQHKSYTITCHNNA